MIVLVDTTVFCNVIRLPGYNQHEDDILDQFKGFAEDGAVFLLPLVVFFETGNFIGHMPDGDSRRKWAQRLREFAREAINGSAPWTPTPFPAQDDFLELMQSFDQSALRGCGLGDHSIIEEKNRLSGSFLHRRIVIWSLDAELAAFSD